MAHRIDVSTDPTVEPVNERFKRSFESRLWVSMITAVVLHFAVFALWPEMTAAAMGGGTSEEIELIPVPNELPEFEEPEPLPRPADPVIADHFVPDDITIGSTDFDQQPVLPPPPETAGDTADDGPIPFVPREMLAPRILNEAEVQRALERAYPGILRDAGIGGVVRVYFHIDRDGVVQESRVHVGSGYDRLDEAALEVSGVMRFSPAMNRDKAVAVWISLPIKFEVRR